MVLDPGSKAKEQLRLEIYAFLESAPEANRANIEITGLLRFSEILDIDKDGDPAFQGPIVYVKMKDGFPPLGYASATLTSQTVLFKPESGPSEVVTVGKQIELPNLKADRIEFFPAQFRLVPKD